MDDFKNVDCVHEITTDFIDIDPDRSMTIYFCIKCEKTFSFSSFQKIKKQNQTSKPSS
tara:strand:- start:931 stop:1104 length:174 start_codon:yes stop_codon:yes gene_type:complete